MASRRERNADTATSQVKLAKAVCVTRKTLVRWIEHGLWPFGRQAPFPIGAVVAWRMVILNWQHDGQAPDPDLAGFEDAMRKAGKTGWDKSPDEPSDEISRTEAERLKIIAQWRKIVFETEVAQGKYVLRTASDAAYLRMVSMVRQKLEQFVGAMPELFFGRSRERIGEIAQQRYDRICLELQSVEQLNIGNGETPVEPQKSKQQSSAASRRHRR